MKFVTMPLNWYQCYPVNSVTVDIIALKCSYIHHIALWNAVESSVLSVVVIAVDNAETRMYAQQRMSQPKTSTNSMTHMDRG